MSESRRIDELDVGPDRGDAVHAPRIVHELLEMGRVRYHADEHRVSAVHDCSSSE